MTHDNGGQLFHFLLGARDCEVTYKHHRVWDSCSWHLGFIDEHMSGSASLRVSRWGFNPSLWTFSFQHISKCCSFALPPQKPLHSVQIDKGWDAMISYKMFSRTCGNHRVGELHWFCNNDPNEQLSDEWCTCVGELQHCLPVAHICIIVWWLHISWDFPYVIWGSGWMASLWFYRLGTEVS